MLSANAADFPRDGAHPRILIIRLSAIGDVLMASPVAKILREAYPNAHIAWIVEPLSAPFVQANPYVDEVIVIERMKRWSAMVRAGQLRSLFQEMVEVRDALRAHKFDIAVDVQGVLKSGIIARLSGAPRRIGPEERSEYNFLFLSERVPWMRHPTRLSQGFLHILSALDLHPGPQAPILAIPAADREAARAFLTAQGVTGAYLAFCVSTSRLQKNWVWSRWGELADQLHTQLGLRSVLISGAERRIDTLSLAESCTSAPIAAAGCTTLLQSAALVEGATAVVGVDTGLTYVGLTSGVPTVALYGSTDPGWLAEESAATVCFHPYPCAPCQRRPSCQHYDCMTAITVPEVTAAVNRILERADATVG